MEKDNRSREKRTLLLALLVMVLWGSLFPMIKIGYRVCHVNTSSVADIMMFAGVRFVICGALITALAAGRGQRLNTDVRQSLLPLAGMGLCSVALHYTFTYAGLAITDSAKTAILKQLGALLYICFSFLISKGERMSPAKMIGAVIGFMGIAVINAGSDGFGRLTTGDMLIIAASVCTVLSNLAGKVAMRTNPSMLSTGVSQLFGGMLLVLTSRGFGGTAPVLSGNAWPVFGYICAASMVSYCIWFGAVRTGNLSKLFIIKFSEPIFAAVFGAVLLGESIFRWQYLAAFVLISLGIVISHHEA